MFVCRTLFPDALRVWYGHNRIVVLDHDQALWPHWPWPPGDYPYQRFAVCQFLREALPPYCRQYIRFLEVAFAPFTGDSRPRDGHPALTEWRETTKWMKRNLNVAGLTLRLITTRTIFAEGHYDSVTTPDEVKEVLGVCNALVQPLWTLARANPRTSTSDTNQHLARFYADLAYPLVTDDSQDQTLEWSKAKDRELKRIAEQFVMGKRYRGGGDDGNDTRVKEPRDGSWVYFSNKAQY